MRDTFYEQDKQDKIKESLNNNNLENNVDNLVDQLESSLDHDNLKKEFNEFNIS